MSERAPRHRFERVRNLLPLWAMRDIRVQYRQSFFDLGWSLITPVITLAGFGFVLTQAFDVDGDGIPYLTFAWSGLVVWTFVATALTRGAGSLVGAANVVRKASFPREVVPLAAVLASSLDAAIGLAVLGVLMLVQSVDLSTTAVAVVPVALLMVVWTSGLAICLAVATSFVRDVQHGLAVLLRIGIFVTPVMYPVSALPPQFGWVVRVNPVAVMIESLRSALLRGQWPNWALLGIHSVGAVAILALGLAYTRRVEGRIADVV